MANDKKLQSEEISAEESAVKDQNTTAPDTTIVSSETDKKDSDDTGWVAVGSGLGIDE
jgi:hypothetical protein